MNITDRQSWLPEEWCKNTVHGYEGIATDPAHQFAVRIDADAAWVSGDTLIAALTKAARFHLHYAKVHRLERPSIALEYAKDALQFAGAAEVLLRDPVDEVSEARALMDAIVDTTIAHVIEHVTKGNK